VNKDAELEKSGIAKTKLSQERIWNQRKGRQQTITYIVPLAGQWQRVSQVLPAGWAIGCRARRDRHPAK